MTWHLVVVGDGDIVWYGHLGVFSRVTWHVGVVSGGVWWGSLTAVTLRTRLAMAVMWRAVGNGGDVALVVVVTWRLVSTKMLLLGPFGHLQGGQRGQRRWLGGGMVVVGGIDVMGQCLAMGGCQTLKLLIINILIFT